MAPRKTTTTQHPERYKQPELREKIKDDITNSDKGGPSGQWTMRKAQLTASEYKAQGGEYNGDGKSLHSDQKNLKHTTYDHSSGSDVSEHSDSDAGEELDSQRRTPKNKASNRSTRGSTKKNTRTRRSTNKRNRDDSDHDESYHTGQTQRSRKEASKKSEDSDLSEAEEKDEKYFENHNQEDNRCQPGYEPVPGKEPFTKGSCRKIKD